MEEGVESRLPSIAAQTFGDLEVLMVDDGSTDRSAEIAAEFAQRNPLPPPPPAQRRPQQGARLARAHVRAHAAAYPHHALPPAAGGEHGLEQALPARVLGPPRPARPGELVRRRRTPELLEVLRFQREDLATTPPVRIRGRWYGDYPFRDELPRSIYRLRREDVDLAPSAVVSELRRERARVVLRGRAVIEAAAREPQRVDLVAVRPGRWQSLRRRVAAVRLPTSGDGTGAFEAVLEPGALPRRDGDRELSVHVRAGGLSRRRSRFEVQAPRPASAVSVPLDGAVLTVAATAWGKLVAQVRTEWVVITAHRLGGDTLVLEGERCGGADELELRRESDALTLAVPVRVAGSRWSADVPRADLPADLCETVWELCAVCAGRRIPLSLLGDAGEALTRTRRGGAAVSSPAPRTPARSGSGRSAGSRPAA